MAIAGQWAKAKARQRTGCRSGVPWLGQALGVLDHRQFGRAFVLSIGETGHEATTAPGSNRTWWRSPASGARSKAGQRTGCRSGVPWPAQALGVARSPAVRPGLRSFDQ
ncbi:MAG: hypothetical protein IPK44_10335 [Candidatus Accumulibacter sp.]|uniref:hypothetical protein n=1 Tax=Accumulibacter sp. TaxID=2053492 RepID=UPI00258FB609|nr:hypothetical protein [Accumulibacter sp.]MBK8114900.1 hypothetical protein [Accumulibacter sp.]